MFPGIMVELDSFHWFMRWDNMLLEKTSEEANFFRHLMRRALFVIEDTEHARLRYMKPGISSHEIHKCTKATMPPPEILSRRVRCALHFMHMCDYETDTQTTNDTEANAEAPKRKQYLKHFDSYAKKGARRVKVRQLINNQLEHVGLGYLSDPSSDVVKIHGVNPCTGKVQSARGTGGCENDHRWLNVLLDMPPVGIAHSERVLDDFYEMPNDRKMVNQLGAQEQPT